mgnify:CR=1 FL=1
MKVTMVAAAAENNALGKNNELVWHLPDDFKRFKKITSHHHIIMGRKTFESFPSLLPNRIHVVITRQKNFHREGIIVAHSLEEALELCAGEEEVFVIGGGEIYRQALPYSDQIELTRVHDSFEADAYFPELDESTWDLTDSTHHEKDEKHKFKFTYLTYKRKN